MSDLAWVGEVGVGGDTMTHEKDKRKITLKVKELMLKERRRHCELEVHRRGMAPGAGKALGRRRDLLVLKEEWTQA